MKKSLFFLVLVLISFSSCEIKAESEKLLNDTMKSVDNVKTEVERLETEIKTATKEFKEAKEALDNIGN